MSVTVPEYVTKPELEIRLKGIAEKQKYEEIRTDERIASMEKLLDSKLTMMQMIVEKNLAQYQAIASETKADFNDLRGEVKAQGVQMNTLQSKIGYYIALLGIGVSVALVLFQMMIK